MKFIEIEGAQNLQPGESRCYDIEGFRPIALYNVSGTLFALDNTCPHAGGPLGEGNLDGEVISCPWHGWKFNVRTGDCLKNPVEDWRVANYPVVMKDNRIRLAIPD